MKTSPVGRPALGGGIGLTGNPPCIFSILTFVLLFYGEKI